MTTRHFFMSSVKPRTKSSFRLNEKVPYRQPVCVYAFVCMYVYVCMYACMCIGVCICVYVCVCMLYVSMYVYVCVCMSVDLNVQLV